MRCRVHGGLGWLLAAGALIGLATFLRPIHGPILAIAPLAELLRRECPRSGCLVHAALFAIPFLVVDGIRTWRNHRHFGGFHPVTNHGSGDPRYSKSRLNAGTELLSTCGGHAYWWEPSSDSRWIGFDASDDPVPHVRRPVGQRRSPVHNEEHDLRAAIEDFFARPFVDEAVAVDHDPTDRSADPGHPGAVRE